MPVMPTINIKINGNKGNTPYILGTTISFCFVNSVAVNSMKAAAPSFLSHYFFAKNNEQ